MLVKYRLYWTVRLNWEKVVLDGPLMKEEPVELKLEEMGKL